MGCEVVVFSSTEPKKAEAIKFGASGFRLASAEFKDVEKGNHLLLCGSEQPDYKNYVFLHPAMAVSH